MVESMSSVILEGRKEESSGGGIVLALCSLTYGTTVRTAYSRVPYSSSPMQSGQQHCSAEPSWSLRERARLSFIYRGLVSNLVAGFEYRDSINRAVYTTCYIYLTPMIF